MKLPWVGRAAFEALISERDFLRRLVQSRTEHLHRIERKEAGMTEVPTEPRKTEPMPMEVREFLRDISPASAREAQRMEFETSYHDAQSWEPVLQQIRLRA